MSEQTNRILSDIRAYIRISAASTLRVSASGIIDIYEKALVYRMLDGKTSQAKIEQTTGVPDSTTGHWLEAFVQGKLASPPDEYNPSHKALFTLEELGIELSALKRRSKKGGKPIPETAKLASKEKETSGTQQSPIQKFLEANENGTPKQ